MSDEGPYRTPETPAAKPRDWFTRYGHTLIGLVFVAGLGFNTVRWLHDDLACPSPAECPPPPPAPVCPGPTKLTQTCDNVCGILGMQQVSHRMYSGRDFNVYPGAYECACLSATRACTWHSSGLTDCGSVFVGDEHHGH